MDNGSDRNNTFFRFEDLRIYHKALNYTKWVNETSRPHMNGHCNGILDRFNNASHNIVLNIAEGSARNKSQFIYYLKMAKSAVRECLVVTSIVYNMGLIDELEETESRNQLMEMTKMIGALISSLQRNNHQRRDEDDDDDDFNHGNDNDPD
ncbi:MAG TPA: four helix bundle protein [Bacteroidales bacterium]|nr:four helix bundle protein [Bacteroidales bacterium]